MPVQILIYKGFSDAIGFIWMRIWCPHQDSNPRPPDYKLDFTLTVSPGIIPEVARFPSIYRCLRADTGPYRATAFRLNRPIHRLFSVLARPTRNIQ
jgi:hypothetical protein